MALQKMLLRKLHLSLLGVGGVGIITKLMSAGARNDRRYELWVPQNAVKVRREHLTPWLSHRIASVVSTA